ncbi:MAG TPA: hypothetical protein ENJ32_04970 [Crenotrichaceae bacterium]|nr:hypothetical protein [Crenotrichaceae bacterium]
MISLVIKTGVFILITATAIFDQLPDRSVEKTTNQVIDEAVNRTKSATGKHQKDTSKPAATYQQKNHSKRETKIPGYRSHRFSVSGYLGQTFVYGEVVLLKNGKLEGYIYHPENSKTYVYGEQSNNKIILYDSSGNLYQMLHR